MTIKLLNGLDFPISADDGGYLDIESAQFLEQIKTAIKNSKIKAESFIGGSFAKKTMIKSDNYDIDIFIRFDKKYKEDEFPALLEKIIKNTKTKYDKLHGSRDYLQVLRSGKLTFEIIPVTKISRPKEALNTTDLSYFHVNYVKNKLKNKKLLKEIRLAKRFFKANRVYGAESYISGFSGYAVECLIIHYKSFEKMIKSFLTDKKILIDTEGFYTKDNLLMEINESKTHSPIVLVDPTFKERNVLAALSQETFDKLKLKIKGFFSKPSLDYFEIEDVDEMQLKSEASRQKAEYARVILSTKKQAGDIAGTKMKKFSGYLLREIARYFDVIRNEFEYKLGDNASLYIIARNKEEIIERGPPLKKEMQKHIDAFKKMHKGAFEKDGRLYVKAKIDFSLKQFIEQFAKKYSSKIKQMGVSGVRID